MQCMLVKLLVKQKEKQTECASPWPACTFVEIFLGMYLCSCVPSKCLHRTLSIEPIIYPSYQGKFPDKLEPLDRADSIHNGQPLAWNKTKRKTWRKRQEKKTACQKWQHDRIYHINPSQSMIRLNVCACVMHLNPFSLRIAAGAPAAPAAMILFIRELLGSVWITAARQIQLMPFQNHSRSPNHITVINTERGALLSV